MLMFPSQVIVKGTVQHREVLMTLETWQSFNSVQQSEGKEKKEMA